jgi:hypothetical protein
MLFESTADPCPNPDFLPNSVVLANFVRSSVKSSTGVADPRGHETGFVARRRGRYRRVLQPQDCPCREGHQRG